MSGAHTLLVLKGPELSSIDYAERGARSRLIEFGPEILFFPLQTRFFLKRVYLLKALAISMWRPCIISKQAREQLRLAGASLWDVIKGVSVN